MADDTDTIELTHPESKTTITARPEHVEMYLSQGWQRQSEEQQLKQQ